MQINSFILIARRLYWVARGKFDAGVRISVIFHRLYCP